MVRPLTPSEKSSLHTRSDTDRQENCNFARTDECAYWSAAEGLIGSMSRVRSFQYTYHSVIPENKRPASAGRLCCIKEQPATVRAVGVQCSFAETSDDRGAGK